MKEYDKTTGDDTVGLGGRFEDSDDVITITGGGGDDLPIAPKWIFQPPKVNCPKHGVQDVFQFGGHHSENTGKMCVGCMLQVFRDAGVHEEGAPE